MRFPGEAGISPLPPISEQPWALASLQEAQALSWTGCEAEYFLYLTQKLRILGVVSLLPHTSNLHSISSFFWYFLSSSFLKKHYVSETVCASVFRHLQRLRAHQFRRFPCLKMEADPASEMQGFIENFEDGQTAEEEDYVRESHTIVRALQSQIAQHVLTVR